MSAPPKTTPKTPELVLWPENETGTEQPASEPAPADHHAPWPIDEAPVGVEPGGYPFAPDPTGICDLCHHVTLNQTPAGRWVHQACAEIIRW